ncbi:MAG: DUF2662 domain-containing protein [Chloroflexota bacterium]|nr:MAG: DUF2662 domain-containing protein [Chloroflexota bacterium]
MKIQLDQLEARLQALIEGSAARLFSIGKNRESLGDRLVAAMRANMHPQADGTLWAPNLFTVNLTPEAAAVLRENQAHLNQLAELLLQVGAEAGLKFPSPPVIKVEADPGLSRGEIRILAHFIMDDLIDTSTMETRQDEEKSIPAPKGAYLIVDGLELYPLEDGLINIGRSANNDLVIDDPRVSRSHAQIRAIHGRYVIFDLDSMGGTFVNKQRASQSSLYPGDVISIAGVPLIFGQDPTLDSGETQDLKSRQ